MTNFWISLNVVLPLFLLMMLGYLLRRFGLMDNTFAAKCNTLLFRVFLPMLVFNSIYSSHIREIFEWKLMLYGVIGVTSLFLILMLIIPRLYRDHDVAATVIQACFRGNVLIFGVPIASQLYGVEGIGPTALISVTLVPLVNLFATLAFSHDHNWRHTIKVVALNPFIIACVLAILLVLFKIKLPSSVETALSDVASIASPLALVVLGSCFTFKNNKGTLKPLLTGLIIRLIILPTALLPIACLLGFRGTYLVAALAAFGTSSSVTSYIVAAESGQEGGLAGQLVVFSALFSVLTIFLIVFLFKTLGLL